jgi:hypothetical protein
MINTISKYSKRGIDLRILAQVCILLLSGYVARGQMIISTGTTLKVLPGTLVTSNENLTLNNGGTLNVQGTLILKKDLQNQNAASNSTGTGTIEFSGAAAQNVSGQNNIQNLTLNNTTGLTIGGATTVSGTLALSGGRITLGANHLKLGPAALVTGSLSAANMVVATGAGELRKEFSGTGSFTFPVGDATSTAEYSPVTIAYNSGTFGAGNYTGVNLVDAQYPGTATSYLTRYWNVTQSGITNFASNATFQYVTADVVGTEDNIFFTKVLPLPFITYNGANTGANQIDAHGLNAFSTFTGNLGNGSVPPGIRSLQDKTITGLPATCADATQSLIIAGNGTIYHVLANGSATHIAGSKINYYPGTKVISGGYLHGYISTIYCSPPNPILAPVIAGNTNQDIDNLTGNSLFKIYPNPTTGKFTLELKGEQMSADVHVDIFGVLGVRILSKDMKSDRKQEFSLSDKPTGVYMVHVSSGNITETQKIIRKNN